jgi:hypothetical protein
VSDIQDKKREAEDFLRDTNELTRKKSLLWQYHMNTLQNNLDITSKAIVSISRREKMVLTNRNHSLLSLAKNPNATPGCSQRSKNSKRGIKRSLRLLKKSSD